jgi:PAS domain S-box-containing protein
MAGVLIRVKIITLLFLAWSGTGGEVMVKEEKKRFSDIQQVVQHSPCKENPHSSVHDQFYIVGIGASADGLEAIEHFFQSLPSNRDLAFIIVQSLDSVTMGSIPQIRSRFTDMPIYRVTNKVKLEPNAIYLIPPEKNAEIKDGVLFLRSSTQPHELRFSKQKQSTNELANLNQQLQKALKEQRKTAAQLRRLATVVTDSNDAVTVQDLQGNIQAWNRGAERMYGYTEAEALKLNSISLVPEEGRSQALCFLEDIKNGKEIASLEVKRQTKDKRIIDVWLTVTKLVDDCGHPVAIATTERDITERKITEESLIKAKNELEIKVAERTQELKEANEQLQQYSRRITQVQEEERKRIAYELHDDTAQYLSILKMEIEGVLQSGKIQSPEIIQKLEYLVKDAERAFNDVRRYSHELRPTMLEHLGLLAALDQIAEDMNKLNQTNHISVEVDAEGEEPPLSEDVKLGLFRIAQEALNNARKHSKASIAKINLKFQKGSIEMAVSDNGIGFNVRKATTRSGIKGSLGLMSMQERAKLIGANLRIESEPGQGTTVTVKMLL